jgi:putative ABC transport system permease protein
MRSKRIKVFSVFFTDLNPDLKQKPGKWSQRPVIAHGLPRTVTLNRGFVAPTALQDTRADMNKLIFANLLHRPMRSVISVLAVAIEVIMILSIVAIFMGMLNSQKDRTNGIGADLMLLPSNASMFNGLGSPSMPVKDEEVLRKLPHVSVVSPAIQKISTNGSVEILYGIDYESFNALKPFVFLSGGKFEGPIDAIIDDKYAGSKNPATGKPYEVGDPVEILDHRFRVSGIVEQGKGGRRLIPLDTMAQLVDAEGKASIFYIKCDNPANDNLVMSEIHSTRGFANNTLVTVDSWLDQMTPGNIPGFDIALEIVTGIAVVIGFLVIFQSMYTAVLERTREIGILKSMGASQATVVGVVLRECGVLAVAGVIAGIAGTYGVRVAMLHFFPTQSFEITAHWIGYAALIAFIGSLCGALYPAWMAARKDPIDALAYE